MNSPHDQPPMRPVLSSSNSTSNLFSRRQLYNDGMSLGKLPGPAGAFEPLPPGKRSVPAGQERHAGAGPAWSTPTFDAGTRSFSSSLFLNSQATDQPRTPGGSLAVGAEMFGERADRPPPSPFDLGPWGDSPAQAKARGKGYSASTSTTPLGDIEKDWHSYSSYAPEPKRSHSNSDYFNLNTSASRLDRPNMFRAASEQTSGASPAGRKTASSNLANPAYVSTNASPAHSPFVDEMEHASIPQNAPEYAGTYMFPQAAANQYAFMAEQAQAEQMDESTWLSFSGLPISIAQEFGSPPAIPSIMPSSPRQVPHGQRHQSVDYGLTLSPQAAAMLPYGLAIGTSPPVNSEGMYMRSSLLPSKEKGGAEHFYGGFAQQHSQHGPQHGQHGQHGHSGQQHSALGLSNTKPDFASAAAAAAAAAGGTFIPGSMNGDYALAAAMGGLSMGGAQANAPTAQPTAPQPQLRYAAAVRSGIAHKPATSSGGNNSGGNASRPAIVRSPLLEEFRASAKHTNWELSDFKGHIAEFAGDQLGSRHIQARLESGASSTERAMVFEEVQPRLLELSTDVFANYVIQKLFEQGTPAQRHTMVDTLDGHILPLSMQMYGCRVIQKAIECSPESDQVRIINELRGHVLECAKDAQSNHVIQRAVEKAATEHIAFIMDACIGQVLTLATHPYGCRVVQRIFEYCRAAPQSRILLDELFGPGGPTNRNIAQTNEQTRKLIEDQYGNYVVQWIIEHGAGVDRDRIIQAIFGHVLVLSQQKFASNVIEKCIVHAREQDRVTMIDELLKLDYHSQSEEEQQKDPLRQLLVHPFANYVVQKILLHSKADQRRLVYAHTQTQLDILKRTTSHSKHLATIEKLLNAEEQQQGYRR